MSRLSGIWDTDAQICASNLQPALTPFAGTTLALLPLMCLQEPL
jgi:hypothetical protein